MVSRSQLAQKLKLLRVTEWRGNLSIGSMEQVLSSTSRSANYTAPGYSCIDKAVLKVSGIGSIDNPGTLSYWYRCPIVTPMIAVRMTDTLIELAAFSVRQKCHHQTNLIVLPTNTRGLNIYIPNKLNVDLYVNYSVCEINFIEQVWEQI